jgi:hypothetical protein
MKLQTQVPIVSSPYPIGYHSEILLLGSCFANHIGSKLAHHKFKTTLNPFGILFHPVSIANLVVRVLKDQKFTEEDLFLHQEQWHSFEVHSELSRSSKVELLHTLNKQLELFKQKISSGTHLILTLGTSWGYEQKANGKWVANCHKLPQKVFKKLLSSPSEVLDSLTTLLTNIRLLNPDMALCLTISPVRHLKDGFVENQRSKAHLVAAVHQMLQSVSPQKVYYFPAYELMMDELRDYRFYESDMVHPNALAVDYIWEKFMGSCISNDVMGTMEAVSEVQKGLAHKAFNPTSKQHQEFEMALQRKIKGLTKTYPHIRF